MKYLPLLDHLTRHMPHHAKETNTEEIKAGLGVKSITIKRPMSYGSIIPCFIILAEITLKPDHTLDVQFYPGNEKPDMDYLISTLSTFDPEKG